MKHDSLVVHLARIVALTAVIVACMFLPFLPGRYDELAEPLSVMAQFFGWVGLLLVPIGALWLIHESRKGARTTRTSYYFGVAAVVGLSMVALLVAVGALASAGFALGVSVLVLEIIGISRLVSALRRLRNPELARFTGSISCSTEENRGRVESTLPHFPCTTLKP